MNSIKDYYKVYLKLKNDKLSNNSLAANAANNALERILSLQARDGEEHEIKVRALIIQQRYAEALGYLNSEEMINLEFFYNSMSKVLYLMKEPSQALKILKEGIKQFPKSIALLNNCGYILDELKDYSEAVEKYNKILLLDPNNIAARNNKAVSLWHKGKAYYAEAIQVLREVIKMQPNCQQTHLNLGIVLAANGEYKEALVSFDNALKIDEHYSAAYYNKAKAYYCLSDVNAALFNLQIAQKCKNSHSQIESSHFKEFIKFSNKDIKVIVEHIAKTPTIITHLDLSQNQLRQEGVSDLMQNTALISLDLRGNHLGEEISLLAKNRTIIDLDLRGITIKEKLLKQLISNPTICNLQIDHDVLSMQQQQSIQQMVAHNQQQIHLFSNACKVKNLLLVESMLQSNLISPHAIVEGTSLTALAYALEHNFTDLAETLIQSYLKYYQPKLPILKLIIDILHKSKNVVQKSAHIELGIQAILVTAVQNGFIHIADVAALGLHKLKLENMKIDVQQAQVLSNIFTANPEISTVVLDNVVFTEEGFAVLVKALSVLKSNIKDITITNAGLKSAHLALLTNILPSCVNLTRLNLSSNLLNYKDARDLLRSISSNKKMTELLLQDNRISLCSKKLFSSEFEYLIHNTSLKQVNINSNNFESDRKDQDLIAIMAIFLRKTSLSASQFISSKLTKVEELDGDGCNLTIVVNENEYIVYLDKNEVEQFNKLKTQQRNLISNNDVYEFMTQEILKRRSEMGNQLLQSKYSDSDNSHSDQSSDTAKKMSRQLLNYHPNSPLKSLLKTCSIFNNTKVNAVKSLILPNIEITHDAWKVFLLAYKSSEHAMLAYEGLTGYGQRFLKIAHLNAIKDQIQIKFYEHDLEDLTAHLKDKYYIALLPGEITRRQVKDMHLSILSQVNGESKAHFQKIISDSIPAKRNNEKVLNCLKWALLEIYKNLKIEFNVMFYHPSLFVKKLIDNPNDLIKTPSPRRINGHGG